MALPEHAPLVDIGANLTNRSFATDLELVLQRAAAAGVAQIVVTGASAEASREALTLAQAKPGRLWSTAGVHPHVSAGFGDDTLAVLRACLADPRCVAVGECGLDYDRDYSPRDEQRRAFARQLELAIELQRPVFLHERAAHGDFVAMLREHRSSLPHVVVHCFTGTGDELDAYLELDAHIGITGWICDERRGHHLRELVPRIPAARLMVETDAPYLLPRDLKPMPRHRRNEPALLVHVAHAVASAAGKPFAQLAAETTAVARAFFGL
ncbi:MAG: TatD family hydrolase [Deltaproteobacteria bacterium]|nr:TatD family hydrolase [Deltaproteobacteria bacterium]MBK8240406.1 TatD family hydrolase [Deltaproteobacteria bacterium]MBK8718318.1 TatD family hydrolase [Deltaproteobacteria bacterium]